MGLDIFVERIKHPRKRKKNESLTSYVRDLNKKYEDRIEDVCYFRKVNCLYAFFEEDMECECAQVTKDDVEDIIYKAKYVLEHRESAKDVFPTKKGFFFGSTDYDKAYFDDLYEIIDAFEILLSKWDDKDFVFIYFDW